jgi:uncharacterized MnhB-related membrane protein
VSLFIDTPIHDIFVYLACQLFLLSSFHMIANIHYVNCHILRGHKLCLSLCTDGYIVACVDVLQLTHGAVATVSGCLYSVWCNRL